MQTIYSAIQNEGVTNKMAEDLYLQKIGNTYKVYLLSLWQLLKTAEYVKTDAILRANKYLPEEWEKNMSQKLYENPIAAALSTNNGFLKLIEDNVLKYLPNKDLTKSFYQNFTKTPEYRTYLENENTTENHHRDIWLFMWKFHIENESFRDFLEGLYPTWQEDESLLNAAIKKTFRVLPAKLNFYNDHKPLEEHTLGFGKELLYLALKNKELLEEIIQPRLQNWTLERLAIIDVILIKMCITEFLFFPSIPIKVSLNEYLEIAKNYSTPKSNDFINGILDKIKVDLDKANKIQKDSRGLIDKT